MENSILFLFFITLLISCDETTTTDNSEENIIENEALDTIDLESDSNTNETIIAEIDTVAKEQFYFEDYLEHDSREKLTETFGAESLIEDTTWYAEGTEMYIRTTLHDPYTGFKILYIWNQEDITQLEFIEAHAQMWNRENDSFDSQIIQSKEGTYLGMPILKLRDWNGADFDFLGFGWDYSGGIMADENSRIGQCNLGMRLDVNYNDYNEDFMGDSTFNTKDVSTNDEIFVGSFILFVE